MIFVSCSSLLLRFFLGRENKRRDALKPLKERRIDGEAVQTEVDDKDYREDADTASTVSFEDLTDKQQMDFRYRL
jgi:hypothetical protein